MRRPESDTTDLPWSFFQLEAESSSQSHSLGIRGVWLASPAPSRDVLSLTGGPPWLPGICADSGELNPAASPWAARPLSHLGLSQAGWCLCSPPPMRVRPEKWERPSHAHVGFLLSPSLYAPLAPRGSRLLQNSPPPEPAPAPPPRPPAIFPQLLASLPGYPCGV